MMMSILNKYGFDSILDLRNGGRFQVLCYQLEVLMQQYLPELEQHMRRLRIPTDIYAANWFITMFCYELSLDLVFCILDVFLLEGIKSLLRISLALLKCMETQLLNMTYDECMVYLSHCQKELEIDSQTLLREAYTFKISNRLLQDIEDFFQIQAKLVAPLNKELDNEIEVKQQYYLQAFNRFSLQLDITKQKHYWIMLPATPEDMYDVIKKCKNRSIAVTEEDILLYYQSHLKHKNLKDIVKLLGPKGDSQNDMETIKVKPNQSRMLPKFIQSAKKTSRKKAYSAFVNDLDNAATDINKVHMKHLDSINTINEVSHEDYSRLGYSSNKNFSSPYKNSYLVGDGGGGGHSRHSVLDNQSPSQKTTSLDYRSI